MKTLIKYISVHEADQLDMILSSQGIHAVFNGINAIRYSSFYHIGLHALTVQVRDEEYEEAVKIIKESYSHLIPKSEYNLCKLCSHKKPPFNYALTDIKGLKGLGCCLAIGLFNKSFCPNCGNIH